ncbi:PREDICTED: protein SENSITIVE TO PROTON RHIZOTOXICITY 1-like [Nelumbo nucifera]|uniref:C2H2-type domain-containing protein n=2 Tax=Nelumbo nucifera TaxID=4432 RepID=A0A822ZU78_NELNU|nr:PREDICTED: protein SENSITIVE TO PROTON RHIZOTOXICITY 1-like [Nelumbo nucifera]DAD48782.1 TPA_asm: hypothetical protein HUJ06_018719 [Nelumbo nucifera]
MISEVTSCFQSGSQGLQMYGVGVADDVISSSLEDSSVAETQSSALLYSLSVLRDKVHQVQSLVSLVISPNNQAQPESTAMAIAGMGTLIQEIIVTASSMMFTCQQMALGSTTVNNSSCHELHQHQHVKASPGGVLPQPTGTGGREVQMGEGSDQRGFFAAGQQHLDWYGDNYNSNTNNSSNNNVKPGITISNSNTTTTYNNDVGEKELPNGVESDGGLHDFSPKNCDIIELEAADLLAKFTHYCHVCGKGFKRDANLRMHMRAHGDEYKTSAALSNPMKNVSNSSMGYKGYSMKLPKKYSCPHEGCRWNKKHAKFQPLKSMICAKNHYKRSHCPKMYVCNRCNQKQFSVLSDLRTHEKHCGELKWQCTCGTTFSRKDKLMGHVALFVGHAPAVNSMMKQGKLDHHHHHHQAVQIQ